MNLSLQTQKADSFRFAPLSRKTTVLKAFWGMSGVLNLLIFRHAQNAPASQIAPYWSVLGLASLTIPASTERIRIDDSFISLCFLRGDDAAAQFDPTRFPSELSPT
jgi:hypothetical protein